MSSFLRIETYISTCFSTQSHHMAYDKRNNKYSTFFIDYFYDGFRGVHKENMQKSGIGKSQVQCVR